MRERLSLPLPLPLSLSLALILVLVLLSLPSRHLPLPLSLSLSLSLSLLLALLRAPRVFLGLRSSQALRWVRVQQQHDEGRRLRRDARREEPLGQIRLHARLDAFRVLGGHPLAVCPAAERGKDGG